MIEFFEECFESWQAIPLLIIRKPKKTLGNELKSQQDRGEIGICWRRNSIESLKKTKGNLFGKVIEILEECFESWQAIDSLTIH